MMKEGDLLQKTFSIITPVYVEEDHKTMGTTEVTSIEGKFNETK